MCGLENIWDSSVRGKSSGITFATFLRQARVEVLLLKI